MRPSLRFLIIAAVLIVTIPRRILADQERGDSLAFDRTPIIYMNAQKVGATGLYQKGIRAMIERALAAKLQ